MVFEVSAELNFSVLDAGLRCFVDTGMSRNLLSESPSVGRSSRLAFALLEKHPGFLFSFFYFLNSNFVFVVSPAQQLTPVLREDFNDLNKIMTRMSKNI